MTTTLNDWVENRTVDPASNPVLQGNFAPVSQEIDLEELEVLGTLPQALNGTLLRNGPNPVNPGPQHHWFSGEGMLHALRISNGKVERYRNRWIRSPQVADSKGLAPAPACDPELMIQGSGGVSVVAHAGRILAPGELGYPFEMNTDLDTKGQYNFAGDLTGNMTAHPKIDGVTGEMLFFGYDVLTPTVLYHEVDPSGTLTNSVELSLPRSIMMHDFGATATRVIFMDLPVVTNLELINDGVQLPFEWEDGHQARLGVMNRGASTDTVRWIDTDPCYVFHPLNSYDDGNKIVMDVVRYEKVFTNDKSGAFNKGSKLVRWTIDVDAGVIDTTILSDRNQEFPRINPRVECHPHRFGYAIAAGGEHGFEGLLKHDLTAGTTQYHDVGDNCAGGEPVFIPTGKDHTAAEDAGYILSVVYNATTHSSELRVLDAQHFEAPALAIVKLGTRIPYGFHGNFIPT